MSPRFRRKCQNIEGGKRSKRRQKKGVDFNCWRDQNLLMDGTSWLRKPDKVGRALLLPMVDLSSQNR
ncbi:hypothetical protein RRG08_034263 [Elysia crispata]|uniref:Uncharacterized protein n=1 Tax=Elysia crispata TaxID=231223 RepID=A0AAE1A0W5_9GAST|nr:hypothetical protein RRG08_034263 [Elysia crispata]